MNKTTVRATVDGVEWLAVVGSIPKGRRARFFRVDTDQGRIDEGGGGWTGWKLWYARDAMSTPEGVRWALEQALRAEPSLALNTSTPATRLAALGQAMLGRPLPPLDLVAQIIGVSVEEVRELLAASTLEDA